MTPLFLVASVAAEITKVYLRSRWLKRSEEAATVA
jgi:hypothetical protein